MAMELQKTVDSSILGHFSLEVDSYLRADAGADRTPFVY